MFEFGEGIEDFMRDTCFEPSGKHRAADDVRRHVAHHQVKRKARIARGVIGKCGFRRRRAGFHRWKGAVDAHHGQGRVNHGPLTPPGGAGGDKDRIANQRIQRMHHQIAFGQDALGIRQHFAHQIGAIDDDRGPAGIAQRPDRHAIGFRRQKREQISIAADHAAHQRNDRG